MPRRKRATDSDDAENDFMLPPASSPAKDTTSRASKRAKVTASPNLMETIQQDVAKERKKTSKSSALTSSQKSAVSEFVSVAQVDKSTAAKILKTHGWDVGAAINAHFNGPAANANNPLRASLSKTFDKYRDDPKEEPDEINIEGAQALLNDLDIDVSDVSALIFSQIVSSPSLGKITRQGFVDGWTNANIDSLPRMRNLVASRRSTLGSDKASFKSVYEHTFTLALPSGAKTLPLDDAIEFWRLLFSAPAFEWRTSTTPWLDWWVEFQTGQKTKAVNRDLWKQTLNFARETIKDDSLGFWSEESSWPSVIDEFVEWVKTEKRPSAVAGGEAMDVE